MGWCAFFPSSLFFFAFQFEATTFHCDRLKFCCISTTAIGRFFSRCWFFYSRVVFLPHAHGPMHNSCVFGKNIYGVDKQLTYIARHTHITCITAKVYIYTHERTCNLSPSPHFNWKKINTLCHPSLILLSFDVCTPSNVQKWHDKVDCATSLSMQNISVDISAHNIWTNISNNTCQMFALSL